MNFDFHGSDEQRKERIDFIITQLDDLISADPVHAAIDIASALLPILRKRYPASSSKASLSAIREIYPDATDASIEERALSDMGVAQLLQILNQVGAIALDYCPSSDVRPNMERDKRAALDGKARVASAYAEVAFDKGVEDGMTPMGVMATMAHTARRKGEEAGVPPLQAARVLNEVFGMALRQDVRSEREQDEDKAQMLAQQMHVTIATARKWVREFKTGKR